MSTPKKFLTSVWIGYGGKNRRHQTTAALREYIKSETIDKPVHVYFYIGSVPPDSSDSELNQFITDLDNHMVELEGKSS
jgi:hypothetical protein